MNKPVQTDGTAVLPRPVTEIARFDSFCNLLVDNFGNDISGSAVISNLSETPK